MSDQDKALVERVAKAMYDATHAGLSNCYAWDDAWEPYQEAHRDRYYREASAAIAALRPAPLADEQMEERAREVLAATPHGLLCPARTSCGYCNCDRQWSAMLAFAREVATRPAEGGAVVDRILNAMSVVDRGSASDVTQAAAMRERAAKVCGHVREIVGAATGSSIALALNEAADRIRALPPEDRQGEVR